MTMSASMQISNDSGFVTLNEVIQCTVTAYNSSGSIVNITSISPTLPLAAAARRGVHITINTAIPANGSAVVATWSVVFYGPTGKNDEPSPFTYALGCELIGDDGSAFRPPPQTVTVIKVGTTLPTPAGNFDFTSVMDSVNLAVL